MRLVIDFKKSAQKNAEGYYDDSKKLDSKAAGAEAAVMELEKRAAEQKAGIESERKQKVELKNRKKEWYERFHWFFTSESLLVIAGRDAHQNENLNSAYFEDTDVFFHADIFGAAVTVLKDGKNAKGSSKEEAAQFAGCYSSAWKEGLGSVNVYSVGRDQVSKSTSKGSLGTGSFLISGEREWYRNVGMKIYMFISKGVLHAVPESTFRKVKAYEKIEKYVMVIQGSDKKSDAAKKIAKLLSHADIDEIMRQLPAGSFTVRDERS